MNTTGIENLHEQLLSYWNVQDANGMASLFCENGNAIGFDGSQLNGQTGIKSELEKVFAHHKTAAYVWKVEEIRFLTEKTNAIQTVIAIQDKEAWKISLFQNTPAQFHGRPELVENMTKELTELLNR